MTQSTFGTWTRDKPPHSMFLASRQGESERRQHEGRRQRVGTRRRAAGGEEEEGIGGEHTRGS